MAKKPAGSISKSGLFEAELAPTGGKAAPPAYRIYADSKIAVSKAVGAYHRKRFDAALKAYELIYEAWKQAVAYYNNNQVKGGVTTSVGQFRRGDATENVIYSNINLMVPATYNKNPDFAINTTDEEDVPFTKAAKPLLNALFKRKDKLNAKPKIKKATGMGLLTNCGVLKLEYVKKDDSVEGAIEELNRVSVELAKAKDQQAVEALYGQLKALEAQVEVSKRSGPGLEWLLPHRLVVDPTAQDDDGCDGDWMAEIVYIPTDELKARFTIKGEGDETTLVFKPTHKVSLGSEGSREDGLGAVMQKLSAVEDISESFMDQERLSYIYQYATECVWLYDKVTKRVFLFLKDDWTWPVWVWDDPDKISRFFPYFLISFGFSTGGTVSVGETSYYLDQQDEINDINRQVTKIRRIVFDYIFYNSQTLSPEDAEILTKALRGEQTSKHVIGLKVEEGQKLSDQLHALMPPSGNYEALFNKEPTLNAINRLTNTSDALRGVQFKTNTNEAAVQTYQDAVKLSVGAKVDVIEDVLSDMGHTLLEMCVQDMDETDVAGVIGRKLAAGWKSMTTEEFNANYSCDVVAGSTEKPNSSFKKKDAIQAAQAVGQFAQAAPGATLRIMLRLLEQAFTEITVKPEEWELLDREIAASMAKGVSTGGEGSQGGGEGAPKLEQDEVEKLKNAPPAVKQRAQQMRQSGATDEEVLAFLKANSTGQSGPAKQKEQENGGAY